jgi:hypothetical protein
VRKVYHFNYSGSRFGFYLEKTFWRLSFWKKSTNQREQLRSVAAVANQSESVKFTKAKIKSSPAVKRLVQTDGLSLLKSDGISATEKIKDPKPKIMSCQLEKYIR